MNIDENIIKGIAKNARDAGYYQGVLEVTYINMCAVMACLKRKRNERALDQLYDIISKLDNILHRVKNP